MQFRLCQAELSVLKVGYCEGWGGLKPDAGSQDENQQKGEERMDGKTQEHSFSPASHGMVSAAFLPVKAGCAGLLAGVRTGQL